MEVKTVIGGHFANYSEAQDASNLVASGQMVPKIYGIYEISKLGQLMDEMFHGRTFRKLFSETEHSLQFFVTEFQSYKFSD